MKPTFLGASETQVQASRQNQINPFDFILRKRKGLKAFLQSGKTFNCQLMESRIGVKRRND